LSSTRRTIIAGDYWATPSSHFQMINFNGRSAIILFEWSKKTFYVLDLDSGAVLSLLSIDWGGKLNEWRLHQNSLYFTLLEENSIFRVADIFQGIKVHAPEKPHTTYIVQWDKLEHIIQLDGYANVYECIANVLCNPRQLTPNCLLSHRARIELFDLVSIDGVDSVLCCDHGVVTVYKNDEVLAELKGPEDPVSLISEPNMFAFFSVEQVMLFVWNGTTFEPAIQESIDAIHSVVILRGYLCIGSRKGIHLLPFKSL
jgi:hypothetical protein